MSKELVKVRTRLDASRSPGGRVPAEMRREVLELVERARAAGKGYAEIAKQLGVSVHTLMGWKQRGKRAGAVQPVRLAPSARSPTIVRGPRGLEVEGLTVSELAELWIRLG